MKAIVKFLEALSANYYEDFIIEDPFSDEELYRKYLWEVCYRKKKCFELDVADISLVIADILEKIKGKFNQAISEAYLQVANKNPNEIYSTIENIKKSVVVHLKIIKDDFHINDKKSRYYTTPPNNEHSLSLQEAIDAFSLSINNSTYFNTTPFSYGFYDLWYDTKRDTVLAYLPMALFTIGRQFISELEKIKVNAISNEEVMGLIPETDKLKWDARPAHLGYILGVLADSQFLDAPRRDNGDINYTQFAKQVLNIFEVESTQNTLSKYLNTTTEKAQETKRKFDQTGFNVPHKKEVN